jgi:hypothetical protein
MLPEFRAAVRISKAADKKLDTLTSKVRNHGNPRPTTSRRTKRNPKASPGVQEGGYGGGESGEGAGSVSQA